jgi:hypothetical protein
MSAPISAMMSWALIVPTPSISLICPELSGQLIYG